MARTRTKRQQPLNLSQSNETALENPARFLHHKWLSLAGPFFMNDARDLLTRLPLCFMPDVAGDLSMTAQYMTRHPVYIVIDDGHCQAHEGLAEAPDVTLRIRDDHLIKLMTGRMRGITAFLTGKIKVEGNYILAQRLQQVFDPSRIV